MSDSLLNRSRTRDYILQRFGVTRPHMGIGRVSKQALDDIEAKLKLMINGAVSNYPSIGKTFMYCQ
jgi:hypothetical protein